LVLTESPVPLYRVAHGLRTPDAIHAAMALVSEADGMLTDDRRLRRLESEGIEVWPSGARAKGKIA